MFSYNNILAYCITSNGRLEMCVISHLNTVISHSCNKI